MGKLNVVTYEKQENELVLVQVGGASIDSHAVLTKLNEVYGPVGVTWRVTATKLDYPQELQANFIDEKSGLLSAYNEKMRALIEIACLRYFGN